MCSLFGLIDYQNTLTTRQKNHILQVLSKECEARGTDATGIAYNFDGSIKVYKRPLAAHKLKFHVPNGVHVVMGIPDLPHKANLQTTSTITLGRPEHLHWRTMACYGTTESFGRPRIFRIPGFRPTAM